MKFPNIEIRYNERLHAKFYQNDSHFIMTSMNLYDYSLAKNIEVGIIGQHGSKSVMGKLAYKTGDLVNKGVESVTEGVFGMEGGEVNPIEKFKTIFETSELKFRTEPIMVKKSGLSGLVGVKKMEGFNVLEDSLSANSVSTKIIKPISVEKTDTKSASQLGKLKGVSGASITKSMEEKGFVKDGQITDAGISNGLVMKKYMGNEYVAYPVDTV